MTQNLQRNSTNSQIQSVKPNNLLNFVKTDEEEALVKCIQLTPAVKNLKDFTPLLQVVSKWRLYIGLPKEDVTEELAIVVDFIQKNYDFLTLGEIELAYNLSVMRVLDDTEFYGSFSPLYVGKVLSSYLYYRKMTLADAIRRKEKYEMELQELKNKPTPEEEANLTKEILKDFYRKSQETGEVNDPFNICYNFLRKYKFMLVSKEDIDEAMSVGEKMYVVNLNKKTILSNLGNDKEQETKRYARNYLVKRYFDRTDIDILLSKVTSELFVNP
jgi:hypothetical protein